MPIPEIPQGGFELSTGQLGQLEAAGVPLHDPVDNAAPRNVEEFRQIDINNLGWYFCKWPTDFNHEAAGQYGRYMMPHFQRFYVLYKDFVDETHPIEEELNRLTKENLPYYETPTWDERAAKYQKYYHEEAEPRFFFAWVAMSRMIDKNDEDYKQTVAQYGARRAIWLMLSR